MEYRAKSSQIEKSRAACVICPVFSGKKLSPMALALDKSLGGYLSSTIKKESFLSNLGDTLLLFPPEGAIERVLLVGMGKEKSLDLEKVCKGLSAAWKGASRSGSKDITFALSDCLTKQIDAETLSRHVVLAIEDAVYKYDEYKTLNKNEGCSKIKQITLHFTNRKLISDASSGIEIGQTIAASKKTAKDLGNCPPNDCTPSTLAEKAKSLAKANTCLETTIVEEKEMKSLGMGAFLSVTRGSTESAKLITMHYTPKTNKDKKPIVFVGKGITFDTGGLNLKPRTGMLTMKYDMLGAATVFALMEAVIKMECPFPVIGVMACSENCIGPDATKPDTIVKTMNGITVEITNTDAEGRLVLCDALTYVERFKPDCVIDMATLTGGVIVALGDVASGVMTNNTGLQKEIENAGSRSRDLVWPLPTWPIYKEKLVSKVADIKNEAGFPSSVLAGVYLSYFTENYPWAHLDIAGTAFSADKLATGRPVHLLIDFLHHRMNKK